jgi:hypothetical protein
MTRLGKEQEAAAMLASARQTISGAMALLPRDPDAHQIRGEALATSAILAESVRKIDHRTGRTTPL